MTDDVLIRTARDKPIAPDVPGPRRSLAEPDIDRLLAHIRRTFDVRAAVIGLAGAGADAGFHEAASFPADALVEDDRSGGGLRICAAIPLSLRPSEPLGILLLADPGTRRLTPMQKDRLEEFAGEAAVLLARRRDALAIAQLRTDVEAHERVIREQGEALAHSRKVFERASAAARIGVWECTLPDESLHWTDGVYDIFDLPRGAPLDRARTLACYPEASRALLEAARSRAIAERSGFTLDAEIVTVTGRRRWIRLTATVECEDGVPARIFGMKQDITEEKTLADRTRYLAEFDVMTELANRAQFQSRLSGFCEPRAGADAGQGGGKGRDKGGGALLLIDLDGFKQVNDTYGHAAGDDCLREAASRLKSVSADADLVARIGGDEFAVLVGRDAGGAEALAARIVEALGRPVDRGGRSYCLGASVGVAWAGGCTSSELFTRADAALYAAKAAGRHTYRVFGTPPARSADPIPCLRVETVRVPETLPNGHAAATLP